MTDDEVVIALPDIIIVLVLGYGVISTDILLWVSVVSILLFLYLLWRFVRAHERIADALEGRDR